MMTSLLPQAGHPECHGIRPHSLKVTTISTLMTEVIKGRANKPQVAIQGNCSAFTAHDMDKVYSRNLAHRQIVVSRLARKDFQGNRDAESIVEDPPESLEECQTDEKSLIPRISRSKTGRLGHRYAEEAGNARCLKKGSIGLKGSCRGNCCTQWSTRKWSTWKPSNIVSPRKRLDVGGNSFN